MLPLILSEQTRTCVDQSVIERSFFFFLHTFERMVMILTLGIHYLPAHIQLTTQPFLDFGLLAFPKDIASCPFLGLLS